MLISFRVFLFLSAGLTAIVASLATPAAAQSLSPWGIWGNDGRSTQRYRSAPEPRRSAPRYYQDDWWDDDYRPRRQQRRRNADRVASGGAQPSIRPRKPARVSFAAAGIYETGAIVIDVKARKLYHVRSATTADVYPIGVGRSGFGWTGVETVSRVASWPDWHPPEEMRRREPHLPVKMTGGVRNPLGARALYLGNTLYRIHGTNNPKSIGTAQSSGCFRMMNAHVVHLASHVEVGAKVHVVNSLSGKEIVGSATSQSPDNRRRQLRTTAAIDDGDFADPADPQAAAFDDAAPWDDEPRSRDRRRRDVRFLEPGSGDAIEEPYFDSDEDLDVSRYDRPRRSWRYD